MLPGAQDILEPAGGQQNDSRLDRRDAWVLAGFLLFLVLYFGSVLIQPGDVCLGRPDGDARSQFYGWRAFGFGEIREGRFPLWNPHEFLGMPFVASLQSAMFYPTNWLCAVLPLGRAINLGIVINLFLSGLFTYLWCRRIGMGRLGGVVAASAYVFGAPQLLRIYEGHWSFLTPMPWIPCVLLCVEVLLAGRGRWAAVAGGGVAVAMGLFGGNPQYVFYGGIAAVLYFAARAWQERASGRRNLVRAAACFAGMYGLGVVLAGVQMIPALEFLSVSSRQGQLSYAWVGQYSFVPENLVTLVAPEFFGSDVASTYWGRFNVWEMSAYVGVVAAGLALAGLLRGRKRWAVLGGALAVVFFLLALGEYGPLLKALYTLNVPGFRLFRTQARFLCPLTLFVGMLAGMGADVVVGRDRRAPRWAAWVIGLAALAIGVAALAASPGFDSVKETWTRFMAAMVGLGGRLRFGPEKVTADFAVAALATARESLLRASMFLGGLTIVLLLARAGRVRKRWLAAGLAVLIGVDVWTYGRKYLETFDPTRDGLTPGAVAVLEGTKEPFRFSRGLCFSLPPCEGMTHGLDCIEGIQPNAPGLFRDVFWSFQGMGKDMQRTSYSIRHAIPPGPFRMLNLRYFVQYRSSPRIRMPGLRTVHEDERIRIEELPGWWPRAWLVHRYDVIGDEDALLERLQRVDFRNQVLFAEDPQVAVKVPMAREARPRVVSYEPSGMVVEVAAAADAFLIVSDLYYPGWQASVDGKPARILRANHVMRAVHVPAGEHRIEFAYRPGSFRVGIAMSLAGCVGVAILLMMHIRDRRRRNGQRR